MEQSLRVRVRGPLAGYAPELIGYLVDQGYADHSVTNHLYRLAHVSGWLESGGLEPAVVDEALVGTMLAAAHAAGRMPSFRPHSFAVVLGFLRRQGVVPDAPVVPPTPVEVLLGNYRRYLVSERSLAPLT
jgi:hypothetical protein